MIGQRVRRREDPRFITGKGNYVDDLDLEGALHAVFVRCDLAHATITEIDASEAAEMPGVQILTAADIDLEPLGAPFPGVPEGMARPPVARDKVRFVGDIYAVVLGETREQAADGSELVFAEFDPLPVVIEPADALRDETVLFEELGTNLALADGPQEPDASLFANCEVITEGAVKSQRIHVAPIEPRSAAARFVDGRIVAWLCTQTPHQDRDRLAAALGLEPERVQVIAPDVGGGFGGKGLLVEDVLVCWLAMRTGRPVRWTETRSEHMVAMGHGRAQEAEFRVGGDREGRIHSLYLRLLQDAGAYPSVGAILPTLTRTMASGVYAIPNVQVRFDSVATNTTPTAALRGAGRPEATQILERAIELFAADVGLDPVQVRKRNFIGADSFPYTTSTGAVYDIGDYGRALDTALAAVGYDELRAEQARRREAGESLALGIGMSAYVEITAGFPETEFGAAEITPEGDAIVKTGSFSHGQGHETTFAQIASEQLGIPVARITVVKGDTDRVARGTGTYGSKSTQLGGVAARQASVELVEKAKELAAEQLEADPRDMVLDLGAGVFHVTGAPSPSLPWGELAARLAESGRLGELSIESEFQASQPTFPFGAHVVVVEVDTETGSVELQRVVCVDDAGTIINPMIAEGQVHGGVAAGIAQALFEELTFDAQGSPGNANFVTYCIPAATEFPMIESLRIQTPTPINPLGAKGIGESGTIGSTPATLNAVLDAVSYLGVRDLPMPANGERVWRAIEDARRGNGSTPAGTEGQGAAISGAGAGASA
ncbi:MAG: xanthine dehydrogenase family protein molybdopterin-binding subunit [Solirubrobacterales bacterium]|nr:xanthine dehydrogenase family protein molybdopterin-binding subunit [Solirubrobacterales bacterium]